MNQSKDHKRVCQRRWISFTILLMLAVFSFASVAAAPMEEIYPMYIKVANDNGTHFDLYSDTTHNNTYKLSPTGGGLNAFHMSNSPTNHYGCLNRTEVQRGTFYLTDTGGKGYQHEALLLIAVRGDSIPDDFSVHIKSSGYQWTPAVGTPPASMDDVTYVEGAVNETFVKDDFIYGPQNWRPFQPGQALPFYDGQNLQNTTETFNFLFVDLNVGVLGWNSGLPNCTDGGAAKVEYSIQNLPSFAAFDTYGWRLTSATDGELGWSNRLNGDDHPSGYVVIKNQSQVLTRIEVTPENPTVFEGKELQCTATALDEWDSTIHTVDIAWSSENETVGTINETGWFEALNPGTTTVTAANGTVSGSTLITVREAPRLATILIEPQTAEVMKNKTFTFTATGFDQYNTEYPDVTLNWSSDNETAGTIDQNGLFTALNVGNAGVTARNGTVSGTAEVTIISDAQNVLYVDGSGGAEYTTIQDALAACREGDLIIVKDGTYQGPVTVDKRVTIRSESGPAKTELYSSSSGFIITADGVEVSGMTISGVSGRGNYGIKVQGAADCKILDNRILSSCREGLLLNGATGTLVENNSISANGNRNNALALIGSTYNTISRNSFNLGIMTVDAASACNQWYSEKVLRYEFNGTPYTSYMGNKYRTYSGTDVNGDGIGDDPYAINTLNQDPFPLTQAPTEYRVTGAAPPARTWRVAPTGGDYSTIQAAVDAASERDTIVVADGTYPESVNVSKTLTIQSENGCTSTSVNPSRSSGFVISADRVTVSGFTISGVTGQDNYGIEVKDGRDCLITENVIRQCREGIHLSGTTRITVTNNTIGVGDNTERRALFLDNARQSTVFFNTFISGIVAIEGSTTDTSWSTPDERTYIYNGHGCTSKLGNTWPGYAGDDSDDNGVGNSPHTIAGSEIDEYPLMAAIGSYVASDDARVLSSIVISPERAIIKASETLQFSAIASDQNGEVMPDIVLTWSTDNGTVGTVNESGFFSAQDTGGKVKYNGIEVRCLGNRNGDRSPSTKDLVCRLLGQWRLCHDP